MSAETPKVVSSKESMEGISLSLFSPEDYGGTLEVQYQAALKNYPNAELGITPADIEHDYESARTPEAIKQGEEEWRNRSENPNQRYFVAKRAGIVIGFCIVDKDKEKNQLNGIYISPEAQGAGLGRTFWNEALQFFDADKETVVMVLPYNASAIGFYKALGFEETGQKAHEGEGHRLRSGAMMPIPIEMRRKADEPKN